MCKYLNIAQDTNLSSIGRVMWCVYTSWCEVKLLINCHKVSLKFFREGAQNILNDPRNLFTIIKVLWVALYQDD